MNLQDWKTLVVGASTNPARYSNLAIKSLRKHHIPVAALGLREGEVMDVKIRTGMPAFEDIDTITLYINPKRQPPLYSYLLGLKPRRIIFNPGTENAEFLALAKSEGVQCITACTLVMLSTGSYTHFEEKLEGLS